CELNHLPHEHGVSSKSVFPAKAGTHQSAACATEKSIPAFRREHGSGKRLSDLVSLRVLGVSVVNFVSANSTRALQSHRRRCVFRGTFASFALKRVFFTASLVNKCPASSPRSVSAPPSLTRSKPPPARRSTRSPCPATPTRR